MKRRIQGRLVRQAAGDEPFEAFVPRPLPPDPPINLSTALLDLLNRASLALGRLDGVVKLLPDRAIFLYMYVRKEAVLSSQIEGTQSSLSDLLLFESDAAPGVPLDDVEEVSRYVAALNHGMARLRGGFPLSLRLLKEIHAVLLEKGRGSENQPGEFRRSQNWIAGTRPGNALYVPPPASEVMPTLGDLEKFLHDQPERTPLLLKAALSHVQFETIHPFLDGNGRLGRLLITLLLCAEGVLSEPLLYLSLYFKAHRQRYYDLLQQVRLEGDWEAWLEFFLEGVASTADQAALTARRMLDLFDRDHRRIAKTGRTAGSALRVHHLACRRVVFTIPALVRDLELSHPTILASVRRLVELGIFTASGSPRRRVYAYTEYLNLLNEGTESS